MSIKICNTEGIKINVTQVCSFVFGYNTHLEWVKSLLKEKARTVLWLPQTGNQYLFKYV